MKQPIIIYNEDDLAQAKNIDVHRWLGKLEPAENIPFAAQAAEYSLLEVPPAILSQVPAPSLSIVELLACSLPPRSSNDGTPGNATFSDQGPQ